MKKWLQLLASLSANKFLWDVASFIHKFACQNFDQMGTGGIGLLQVVRSWSVTKSLTNQKAELQKFISENFVVSRTKETSSYIFTPATPLVAPKMINFAPKRNATYMSGTPFPTLLSFFTPTSRVCTDGRTTSAGVITKYSGIDRFPFAMGKGLRCAHGRSAIKIWNALESYYFRTVDEFFVIV